MTAPRRILFRSPNWVGDAVMATPPLRSLRASQPQAEILLEAPAPLQELFRGLGDYDAFLPAAHGPQQLLRRARELRDLRVDWAVLLPDSPRAALPAFLAGIPRRVGYARDPLRRALLTEPLDVPRDGGRRVAIPVIDRYLAVTRHLDCEEGGRRLALRVDPLTAESVAKRLAQCGVGPEDRLLVVSPGAGFGASKRWPAQHFAEACDTLARRHGLVPVIAPAPNEVAVGRDVAERMSERCVHLADPALDLGGLKALVARATLLLTGDTGPRQIAVALNRPVVVLMGPTDPRHTASHLDRQRVLRVEVACAPCHLSRCPIDHRCMTRLAPEHAVAAAEELLV